MTAVVFERRYRLDPDPWSYTTSAYEHAKYAATLHACGPGPFESALELGASIGVFSARLATRCDSLATIDFSPTAVRLAEQRLAGHRHVHALLGRIPDDIPAGSFDLVLASEILYYLERKAMIETLGLLQKRLLTGGRLVCVHWRARGPERPLSADDVHEYVRSRPWLRSLSAETHDQCLLDVLERL